MSLKVELIVSMREMKAPSREIIVKVRYLEKKSMIKRRIKKVSWFECFYTSLTPESRS